MHAAVPETGSGVDEATVEIVVVRRQVEETVAAEVEQDHAFLAGLLAMEGRFDEARAAKGGRSSDDSDEEAKLEQFVLGLGDIEVPTEVRCIRGNTGFVAADFVKSVEADLLVVPLDPQKNEGQLPPNLEWLTDVIPCNLWVIR